ncbi:hypothetical protein DDD_1925 [Nonlabens dokdonensis DSW-6]|uniref:FAD-dependent urate hydroxylase HpyO/Asp monooxygenase CreE-like FAD/NAD(P)-binding domain-containing protein n=2 Tax=Nonlabens dokdonensis TaxID=328515 RepID=L7WA01_NONDD|nr:hypothetical protein DDD_1925 [Nonlabens dokdonensis DSW-6]
MDSLSRKRTQQQIEITIYDKEVHLGSGQVWKEDQPDANWLNIADRALKDLKGRTTIVMNSFEIPAFPSFIQWMEDKYGHKVDDEVDAFPARNKMGTYLNHRFKTISTVLISEGWLLVKHAHVHKVQYVDKSFLITSDSNEESKFDECLLTIGHQPTEDDSQIASWKASCENGSKLLFDNPYESDISKKIDANDVVGVRGFGLAMIDIMRQLTVQRGASFKELPDDWRLKYCPSDASIKKIIPFSLDGLPVVPKPLGKKVDDFFKPSEMELKEFESTVSKNLVDAASLNNIEFLLDAFVPVAVTKFKEHPSFKSKVDKVTLEIVAREWLNDMSYQHEVILDTGMETKNYISQTIEMSLGKIEVSLDYVIGQVWRHLQPVMYDLFSHSNLHDLVMAQVIALDESTKRYSYGPPVESMIQMLALIENGVIQIQYVKNPNIECKNDYWFISKKESQEKCTVMINTVLDPPQLREIDSPIIKNLLQDDLLEPVTCDLGIATDKAGTIRLAHENEEIKLTALGRNCKGSVMGVDAILECFGSRIKDWSEALTTRL